MQPLSTTPLTVHRLDIPVEVVLTALGYDPVEYELETARIPLTPHGIVRFEVKPR